MKKITYERLQGCPGVRIVAGILEKCTQDGKKYFNVFVWWKQGGHKIERTDFRTIHDRQKAIENSYTMLEQAAFDIETKGA